MKAGIGAIGAGVVASACCIGPVVFALVGAGALGAAAVKLEPVRPWFIALTVACVGLAFYGAYGTGATECDADGVCTPASSRRAKILAWIAAGVAAALIAFPHYVEWFV